MRYFAVFSANGEPSAFYNDLVYPDTVKTELDRDGKLREVSRERSSQIPNSVQEITESQWNDLTHGFGSRKWDGQKVVDAEKAVQPTTVVVVYKVDFYRRMTEVEADQVDAEVLKQSARQRGIFQSANSFRSDAPEWTSLEGLTVHLFGPDRAAELLASSPG